MKRSSRVVADRSADPLRILLVEDVVGETDFMFNFSERTCTVKRFSTLEEAVPSLRTSLFHLLIVNQFHSESTDWNTLKQLEKEFPTVEIAVLVDAE